MLRHDIVPRSLPSKLAQAGSSHSHFLSASLPRGATAQRRCEGKISYMYLLFFSCLESFFLPRTSQKIHCDCARECFARADEKRLQWHRNHICTNVNSDHDKAVVVETLMMGLLVSGLVWLKVKQRKTKGTFPNYKHPSYHQGVGLFLYILYIISV